MLNKKCDSVVCLMFIVKSSNVHKVDCLREETVPVPGRSGAL